jgi:hypothetical protein
MEKLKNQQENIHGFIIALLIVVEHKRHQVALWLILMRFNSTQPMKFF